MPNTWDDTLPDISKFWNLRSIYHPKSESLPTSECLDDYEVMIYAETGQLDAKKMKHLNKCEACVARVDARQQALDE